MPITFIEPSPINMKEVEKDIDDGLLAALEVAKVLFYESYHNWEPENYPNWKTVGPKTIAGTRELVHSTEDTPYTWVDNGTDGPYKIPKAPGFLKFKTGGRPKTQPGRLQSMVGSPGTQWRTAAQVEHPGIKPRNFSEQVGDEVEVNKHVDNEIKAAKSY